MKFIDILDDCKFDEEIIDRHDKRYCTLMLSRKEFAMLRWSLKTKDAIDDVLDEEMNISHEYRKSKLGK